MNFPKEHCSHPQYKTEWWYFAAIGELDGIGKTNYHVSFFRRRFRLHKRDIYFAHFGLTRDGKFEFKEKRNETLVQDSYCDDKILRFNIQDWAIGRFRDRFTIKMDKTTTLTHIADKRPSVNREGYYSVTNMFVKGIIDGEPFKGKGWFDHEFNNIGGKEALDMNYKWFAIQLDTNIEMVLYIFPKNPALSGGKIIFPNGDTDDILPGDYCLRDGQFGWILELPKYGMALGLAKTGEADIDPDLGAKYTEGCFDIMSRGKIGQGFFEIVKGI